jgi:TRAP transporter TAXI family solute receptor
MFEKYPYLSRAVIPAGTYNGQSDSVVTFQDAALWVVNRKVKPDVVYDMLKAVFGDEGLAYLTEVHQSAAALDISSGINGIVTQLHPGAVKFWSEKGVLSQPVESVSGDLPNK